MYTGKFLDNPFFFGVSIYIEIGPDILSTGVPLIIKGIFILSNNIIKVI